ncbi:MAG: hypothetical protein IT478_13300, partial [Xanthomonadales bacterium]|nr:hypothetical protein [Xanthomonadales bacterium]
MGAVLLGLHDEEGLPLVVEATLPQTAWRLTMRENRESGVAGEPGLCLMPTGTSDVATGALKELTQAIFDPASTLRYGDLDVRIRRLRWLAAVTDTRWRVADVPGKERRVVVQDQAPRSIKGFALDTQVTCARAGARQGIPAKLCFNQVHGGTGSIAFSAVELLFGDTSANWRLEMQYAEEDKAGALFSDAATAGVVQIDRFSSHSKPGTFALPVSDARAAFRDTNSDKWWGQWQQASSTALAMAFKELTPAPLNETASVGAGFSRKDSAAQPLLSVLGDRKKLARSDEGRPALAGTVRMRPRLGTKQVSPTPAPGNHIPIGGGALGLARWLSAMVFGQTQQETDSSFGFGDGLLPAGQIEEFEQALNRRIALIEQLVLRRPTASLACTARANSVPCTGDLAKYTKLVDDIKAPGDAWQMVREKWTESRFATDGCAAPLAEHIRLLRVLKQLLAQGESTLREQLAALAAEASDLADPKAFDAWWQQGAPLRAVVQQVLREAPKTRSAAAHLLTRMLQRLAWQAKAFDDDRYARFVSQLKKLATKIGDVANDMNNTIDQLKGLWPTVAFLSVAAQQTAAENVEEAVSAVVMTNPMVVADVAAFLKACRQAETELGQQGKEFLKELIEFMAGIESFATAVNVPSLDHLARVGEDMVVQRLQEVWDGYRKQGERWLRDHEQQQRDELRKLLQDHPILNDETLKLIRDLEAGVRSALAAAANLGEAGADLLREVRSQPLDYVAIGRGVNFGLSDGTTEGYAAVRSAIEKLTSSVGRPLAVCDLGSGFSWDYLACENSVYLLKLGKRRPLDDILGELHERVRTDELPDPLRLVGKVRNTDPKPEAEKEKIRTWVSDMVDAEVAAADWQGLIILKPSIDFSDDKMTSEMCGLSQLTAEYVAFSGGTRDRPGKKSKSMQVWARIRSEAPKEAKENGLYPREAKDSDGALTLIEFDAHIRGTRLLPSSRVEMRLDMGRLFGKKAEDAAAAEERSKWRIRIVGRVIEPQKADAAPRFEFTAALEDALQIDIDKLFFKSIEIRRIEGVYRNQRATLAVNASIALKSTDGSAFQTSGDGKLMLSDFRMVFPRLDGASAVGRPREMRFDLGSLRGLLNPKRALTLGNFEFEVVGFGYLRSHPGERVEGAETADWRERDEQRKHLNRCFKPIGFDGIYSGSDFDAIGEMPYVVFSVTFGGLPVLDRKAASKLRIGLLVGLMTKETGGSARNEIVVAAGDLDASKIDINLFRVIRIQIERLLLLPDERSELDGRQYSAFYVEDFRLNILGWNLIGNQSEGEKKGKNGANVLHMQDHKGERGFAVFVPEPNSGDLIEMQWL